MKKNKTMRAASVLTVATLLSTSIVSGTFAKYVSEGGAGDEARVAKWGVVINGSGNLFSKNYLTGTANTPTSNAATTEPLISKYDDGISVASSNDNMLVAPGTQSENGLNFGITGKPEVDARVKATVKAKDVYLAKGKYAVMTKAAVSAANFVDLVKGGLYFVNTNGNYELIEECFEEAEGIDSKESFEEARSKLYVKSGDAYNKVALNAEYNETATYYVSTYDSEGNYYYANTSVDFTTGEDYYPVKYSGVDGQTTANGIAASIFKGQLKAKTKTVDSKTVLDKDEYGNTVYEFTENYNANTDLAILETDDVTIGWVWDYHTNIDATWDDIDFKDTILGDIAASSIVVSLEVQNEGETNEVVVGIPITADPTTGFVTSAAGKEYGCIRTTFDIDIEAVQID